MMNQQFMDYEVEGHIWADIEKEALPITTVNHLQVYFGMDKWEAREWVAYYLELKRKWDICNRVGHKFILVDQHGGPDTGYDSVECKTCGYSVTHTYY